MRRPAVACADEEDYADEGASDDALAAAYAADAGARRATRRPRRAHAHALSAAAIDGIDEEGDEPLAERDPDAFEEHGAASCRFLSFLLPLFFGGVRRAAEVRLFRLKGDVCFMRCWRYMPATEAACCTVHSVILPACVACRRG
jgi:hypothetical protein